MEIGSELVVQTTQGIIERNVDTRTQRSFIQGSEVLKPAPKLSRELCHIDWNDSTKQIYNLIRGLSPYPAAFTELVKEGGVPTQLKIFSAEKVDDSVLTGALRQAQRPHQPVAETAEATVPGRILTDGKTYLYITTADGAISLKDVQIAGKKRMDIKAFLAGFREPELYTTTAGSSKAEIAKTKA